MRPCCKQDLMDCNWLQFQVPAPHQSAGTNFMYLNLIPHNKTELEHFVLKPSYFSRPKKLDLVHTLGLDLFMAANRNLDGYDTNCQDYFAELSTYLEEPFPLASPGRSSYCEARQKIAS